MSVYYNEFDPFASAWLKELMKAGAIPDGEIDTRSITEVSADDIKGFTQCHFFAGIGGWVEALRLANWPTDRPVWTGSCPCQPFSTAGKQKGKADERHLWPIWFGLIRECKPPILFGEQVAAAITKGWLDSVYDDLESEGYAVGSAVLPACSVGVAHRRERLWFVGNAEHDGFSAETLAGKAGSHAQESAEGAQQPEQPSRTNTSGNVPSDVANSAVKGLERPSREELQRDCSRLTWISYPDGKARAVKPGICLLANGVSNRVGKLRGYGNAIVPQVAAEFIKATM